MLLMKGASVLITGNLNSRRNFSTRDHVYETLRESIIKLELKPGQSISEKEISALLNVSRTPVREAFVKLAQEELLEVYPQRGTFISLIDLEYVEEVRFIRELLERASAKLAAENSSDVDFVLLRENLQRQKFCMDEKNYMKLFELDEEFHHIISIGAGKPRIWSVLQNFNAHLNRIRMLSLASNYNWDQILSQHLVIAGAIENGDGMLADEAMGEHLRKLRFELDSLKEGYPTYFK
ncbi:MULTISPECIES: GntR family transcriptional regulator [unclassified Lysinibacillus]|uniref:GntR family transcriptional regulator n=1 Tax=unclassified Lysinibacillus TaxID=2636778 RepID=UPI001F0EE56B|nr:MULTISPECIES: GntR family transcriptional regulator [unclassified Lysinibacillus]